MFYEETFEEVFHSYHQHCPWHLKDRDMINNRLIVYECICQIFREKNWGGGVKIKKSHFMFSSYFMLFHDLQHF